MVTLILVRHAKSDWGDPGLPDHDRSLNARGQRDAPVMADRLAARLHALHEPVDRLISSTALRARTTAAVFADALGVALELDPQLYLASPETLTGAAVSAGTAADRGGDSPASTVLLVAHEPGLSELAARLTGGGITEMPTCAVARITWRHGAGAAGPAEHSAYPEHPEHESWTTAVSRVADAWELDTPKTPAA